MSGSQAMARPQPGVHRSDAPRQHGRQAHESAWHRRARRSRQQDRLLLAAIGARQRLERHHAAPRRRADKAAAATAEAEVQAEDRDSLLALATLEQRLRELEAAEVRWQEQLARGARREHELAQLLAAEEENALRWRARAQRAEEAQKLLYHANARHAELQKQSELQKHDELQNMYEKAAGQKLLSEAKAKAEKTVEAAQPAVEDARLAKMNAWLSLATASVPADESFKKSVITCDEQKCKLFSGGEAERLRLQQSVLAALQADAKSGNPYGLTVLDLRRMVGSSEAEIKAVLTSLQEMADVYNTLDDETFAALLI